MDMFTIYIFINSKLTKGSNCIISLKEKYINKQTFHLTRAKRVSKTQLKTSSSQGDVILLFKYT